MLKEVKKMVDQIWALYDTNGDGILDWSEGEKLIDDICSAP